MDLDLRKLRYFAAVAEHQHFGRAAEELYIAQPVLSRQIRSLERELGCDLFVRTTRSVQLTPAGEQLRQEARGVFATVDSAVRRVHEIDRGVQRMVVGFASGLHLSEVVLAFTAKYPEVEVDLLRLNWWDQDAPLRDGRADVGFLRGPFDRTGMEIVPIGRERRVACLPVSHRLADRESVVTADLDGESIMNTQARRMASLEEKFELIASGHGIALVPETVARLYPRPDLVYLPILDNEPDETCLVVPTSRRTDRVLDFLDLATATLQA
ncbi:LysR family transcriptional regulator [Kribbella sp. NPDC051718]|uniref:LysR family transcriptional regulator n=1 Tax=Kribbella sp. NPDC051718 TaxID=3155168 RepID=UPI00343F4110